MSYSVLVESTVHSSHIQLSLFIINPFPIQRSPVPSIPHINKHSTTTARPLPSPCRLYSNQQEPTAQLNPDSSAKTKSKKTSKRNPQLPKLSRRQRSFTLSRERRQRELQQSGNSKSNSHHRSLQVSASWAGIQVASSTEYEVYNGIVLFPSHCVNFNVLKDSNSKIHHNPIGAAQYYDIVVRNEGKGTKKPLINRKCAWKYEDSLKGFWKPLQGYVGFWKGVKISSEFVVNVNEMVENEKSEDESVNMENVKALSQEEEDAYVKSRKKFSFRELLNKSEQHVQDEHEPKVEKETHVGEEDDRDDIENQEKNGVEMECTEVLAKKNENTLVPMNSTIRSQRQLRNVPSRRQLLLQAFFSTKSI
mmetsp:Transcript_10356/g.18669  ORF Transcript_10356/g.18669 Transcript_10356/m.18669 type:complete len:363 (-) Transcript_10356:2475-3563(-)